MFITARGFVKDPTTGTEKEVEISTGLHGTVDTELARAVVCSLIKEAKSAGCVAMRVVGFTATNEAEWRPDHFRDI